MRGTQYHQRLFIAREQYSRNSADVTIPVDETWVVVSTQGPIIVTGGSQRKLPILAPFVTASLYKLHQHIIYRDTVRLFEMMENSFLLQVEVLVTLKDPIAYIQSLEQNSGTLYELSHFLHGHLVRALEHLISLTPQAGETLASPLSAQDLQPSLLNVLIPKGDVTPFINRFLEFYSYGFKANISVLGIDASFSYRDSFQYANTQLAQQIRSFADWLMRSVPLDFSNKAFSLQRLYTACTIDRGTHKIERDLELLLRLRQPNYQPNPINKVLLKDLLSSCFKSAFVNLYASSPMPASYSRQQTMAISPQYGVPFVSTPPANAIAFRNSITTRDTIDLTELPATQGAVAEQKEQQPLEKEQTRLPSSPLIISAENQPQSSGVPVLPQLIAQATPESKDVARSDVSDAELPTPPPLIAPSSVGEETVQADSLSQPPLSLPQDAMAVVPKELVVPAHDTLSVAAMEAPKDEIVEARSAFIHPPSLELPQQKQTDSAKKETEAVEPPSLTPQANILTVPGPSTPVGPIKLASQPLIPSEPTLSPPDLSIQQHSPTLPEDQQDNDDVPHISRYITAKLKPVEEQQIPPVQPPPQQMHLPDPLIPPVEQFFVSPPPLDEQQVDMGKDMRMQHIEQLYSRGGQRWHITPLVDTFQEMLYVDIGEPYTILVEIPERYPEMPPIIEAEDTNLAEKLPQSSINRIVQPLFFQHKYNLYQLVAVLADNLFSGSFWFGEAPFS